MNIDLGLESLHSEEPTMSFEELMVDVLESEQQFSEEQAIFDSIDRLGFIRDYVSEHGVSDTISNMIGDQISYSSAEELVEKIDVAIEALLSKVTGDTLDNTLKQIKEFVNSFTLIPTRQHIAAKGMKVKFVDLSDDSPMVPFITGTEKAIYRCVKSLTGKIPEENVNKYLDDLKECVTTGNTILRNMKLVTMDYEEYRQVYKEIAEAAHYIRAKFRTFEMIKMLESKTSADLYNDKLDKIKSSDKLLNKPTIIVKANSLIRGLLRVIRIIFAKGYAMVQQIKKDMDDRAKKSNPMVDYIKSH